MLVYIRESDKDKIICNVDEKDIAEHLRVRLLLIFVNYKFKFAMLFMFTANVVVWFEHHISDTIEERARRKRAKKEGKSRGTSVYCYKGTTFRMHASLSL